MEVKPLTTPFAHKSLQSEDQYEKAGGKVLLFAALHTGNDGALQETVEWLSPPQSRVQFVCHHHAMFKICIPVVIVGLLCQAHVVHNAIVGVLTNPVEATHAVGWVFSAEQKKSNVLEQTQLRHTNDIGSVVRSQFISIAHGPPNALPEEQKLDITGPYIAYTGFSFNHVSELG